MGRTQLGAVPGLGKGQERGVARRGAWSGGWSLGYYLVGEGAQVRADFPKLVKRAARPTYFLKLC